MCAKACTFWMYQTVTLKIFGLLYIALSPWEFMLYFIFNFTSYFMEVNSAVSKIPLCYEDFRCVAFLSLVLTRFTVIYRLLICYKCTCCSSEVEAFVAS